jgi:LysM repeat protein
MLRKAFIQTTVLILFALTFLATPLQVYAGGVCGGAYTVGQGETLESIAATCGTTVAAITAANPGIGATVYPGQVLTVPGINYVTSITPLPVTPVPATPTPVVVNNYYNTYNYYNAPVSYGGTYTVQAGDTFSAIASRYGMSVNELWALNPYIQNINLLYVGQIIYIPTSGGTYPYYPVTVTPTAQPVPLSYGKVPYGSPVGKIKLSPKTSSDIYISLQGTTKDGINIIHEYPVNDAMTVNIPAGRYTYVAWVGGLKFTGQFNLGDGSDHSITFYDKKVVVQ